MGRSVATHANAERIIYFTVDEDAWEAESWDELQSTLVDWMADHWPSVHAMSRSEWYGSEVRLLAQNDMAKFWLSEYGGMYALSITAKEDDTRSLSELWIHRMNFAGFPFKRYSLHGHMSNGVGVFHEVPA